VLPIPYSYINEYNLTKVHIDKLEMMRARKEQSYKDLHTSNNYLPNLCASEVNSNSSEVPFAWSCNLSE